VRVLTNKRWLLSRLLLELRECKLGFEYSAFAQSNPINASDKNRSIHESSLEVDYNCIRGYCSFRGEQSNPINASDKNRSIHESSLEVDYNCIRGYCSFRGEQSNPINASDKNRSIRQKLFEAQYSCLREYYSFQEEHDKFRLNYKDPSAI
jgi:hypothetical protein